LNNTYLIKEKDLKVALDQMDNFRDKMMMFSEKYPQYNYKININKEDDEWIIELNINNNEKRKTQTS